ncbi:MAG TPA: DUF1836 domain-containing protein [Lachnospiraceae bacterium]|nr:DUF1836 domain-containing protein [Lachnospiraceae bacterium]
MNKDLEKIIKETAGEVGKIEYINSSKIPGIDLYMDQVTTFMEEHLSPSKRYDDDKILTKTMINNYAKNELIPPPVKKKYNKEHILLLTFIYYFKNLLSINDIQKLLSPLVDKFYQNKESDISLTDLYDEIFKMCDEKREILQESVARNLQTAESTFENAAEEDRDYLQLFAFIGILSQDAYAKLLIIEKLLDTLPEPTEP